jgi:membrane-associated phospholipid phosphatase
MKKLFRCVPLVILISLNSAAAQANFDTSPGIHEASPQKNEYIDPEVEQWEYWLDVGLLLSNVALYEWYRPHAQPTVHFFTQGLDDRVRSWLHGDQVSYTNSRTETIYQRISDVGFISLAIMPALLTAFEKQFTHRKLVTTVHTFLVSFLATHLLKFQIQRVRPKPYYLGKTSRLLREEAASFPSGHSSSAFTAATAMSLALPDWPWWAKGALYSTAGVTALSRIGGDMHFFSDVLVGSLIGWGSAYLVHSYFAKPEHKSTLSLASDGESIYAFYELHF